MPDFSQSRWACGIYRGIIEDATPLVERVGGDLWVVRRDTRGPFAEISKVPPNPVYRAQAVPGVQDARRVRLPHRPAQQRRQATENGRPLNQGHFEMIADRSLQLELCAGSA